MRSALCVVLLGINVTGQDVRVVSPEVGPDRRVTFRAYAPAATKVEVVQLAVSPSQGLLGNSQTLPMTLNGDIWSATSAPLAPDIYSYRFSIDGKVVNDPANSSVIEEMLGAASHYTSRIAVPGTLWTDVGAPAGAVTRETYPSPIMGADEPYLVYTPPGYDAQRAERYPVVYLLHGLGDSAASWVTNGGVDLTLNNLIAQRRARPMVVVMPLSAGRARMGLDANAFEKLLFDELIPRVERSYHVSRDPQMRAIAGVSIGGTQAVSIGMRRTDMFASIGLFSVSWGTFTSTPGLPDPRPLGLDLSTLRLVFIGAGSAESPEPDRTLARTLEAKNIRVVTVEVPALGHVWPVWRRLVGDFAQTLFP